jgi:hypothetical protein
MSQQHIDALENSALAAAEVVKLLQTLADSMEEFHELVEDYEGEANVVTLDLPVRGWADCIASHRLVARDMERLVEYCLAQRPRTSAHRLALKLTRPVLKMVKEALVVLESLPPPPPGGGGSRIRRAA